MAKAVLTTKVDPTYDDLPEERYHFPRTYLRQVEAAKRDCIVSNHPRRPRGEESSRGGRQAYFATARIADVVPDTKKPDHFYALMEAGSYVDFVRPVPFREGSLYYEAALERGDGATNKGAFGRAVRSLSDREYDQILAVGFATILKDLPVPGLAEDIAPSGFSEPAAEFEHPMIERLVARPFRDAVFSGSVKAAYHDTCAFTGLKIINGGGRSEAQAAHIRPVASRGPDSLRNGVALCATMHWMFDRGLISISDKYELLIAEKRVPSQVMHLVNPDRRLIVPGRADQTPHPLFLRWHRENVFKG